MMNKIMNTILFFINLVLSSVVAQECVVVICLYFAAALEIKIV